MATRGQGAEFIEALARGLDVLRSFSADRPSMTLTEIAGITDLARPTARRILLTLQELGYVRIANGQHSLTPRVLDLGMAYIGALSLWDLARPHLENLVSQTHESSSMAQLDGSDIVYVARVAVPKLIGLRVDIGTRFPAAMTSQGKVLLAAHTNDEALAIAAQASRSGLEVATPSPRKLIAMLDEVRDRGWAAADEELAPGVRSIAVPVVDKAGVRAAMNVTVHAAETTMRTLCREPLRALRIAAEDTSRDWIRWQTRPIVTLPR